MIELIASLLHAVFLRAGFYFYDSRQSLLMFIFIHIFIYLFRHCAHLALKGKIGRSHDSMGVASQTGCYTCWIKSSENHVTLPLSYTHTQTHTNNHTHRAQMVARPETNIDKERKDVDESEESFLLLLSGFGGARKHTLTPRGFCQLVSPCCLATVFLVCFSFCASKCPKNAPKTINPSLNGWEKVKGTLWRLFQFFFP